MIPHITLYIVIHPNGSCPLPFTASSLAKDARKKIAKTYGNQWQNLYRQGYRVMKLRCQPANGPIISLESSNGGSFLHISDLGHRKVWIEAGHNCVRSFDASGTEETVLHDFLNKMK